MMNFRNSNNRNSSALNNIRNKNGRRPLGNDIGPMINAGQGGGFGILGHAPSMPTGMSGGGMNNMGGGGGGMNNMGGGGGGGGMNNMGGGRVGGMNNNMANMNNMGNFGGMMPQQATNMGMGGMVGMGSGMMMQQHQQQQHHQQQQRQNLGVQQQQAMRETQLALVNTLLKGSMMSSGGRNRNPQGGGSAAAAAAAAAAGMGFGMLGSHGQLPSLLDIKTSGLKRRAGSESMSSGVKKMKKDNTERSSRGKERIIRPNDRRRPQGGNPTTTTTTTTKKRDPQYSQGRKDQPSNRRQRDTSAKKKLDDNDDEEEDDDEMYDPAEPTDDEIQSTEHSNGGLTVTIDGNKRSVTEDSMRDSGSDSEKTDSSERKSQYFCHACMVECYNNKNFKNHMRGTKHRSRMDDLANLHQQKATQLFVRLKAEEHLRNIEKRGAEPMKKHYCSVCELNLSIPYNKHRQTREHQLRVLEVYGNNKGSSNQQRKGQKTEEYTEVPEYEENKAYGQNYIIPVSGYFCKLCHKFYNNENAAKNTHCQSKAHFEKFEKIIREKIEAKKNAEAGESESEVKEDETREFEEDEMEVNKDNRLEEENCEADDDDNDDDEMYAMQSSETMPANIEEDLDKTLVPDEDEDSQNDVDEESDHEERKDEDDEMLLAKKNSSSTIEKSTMDDASREDTEEEEEEEDAQAQKQQLEEEKQPQQQIVDKSEKQSSGSLSEGEEEKEKEQTSKGRNRSRGRGRGRGRGKK